MGTNKSERPLAAHALSRWRPDSVPIFRAEPASGFSAVHHLVSVAAGVPTEGN